MASLLLNASEFLHTSFNFEPFFQFDSEQSPMYDTVVYYNLVWDREYSLNAGITMDLTFEFAHAMYYKWTGTLTFLRLGFGVQDIWFPETKHYCSNFYLDGRSIETSVIFETNAKSCVKNHGLMKSLSFHWDSRDMGF